MKVSATLRPAKSFKVLGAAASAKPLSSGDKATDLLALDTLTQQIAALQARFHAARQRKILVVLQGMDTSGKDGTMKGVFSHVNSQGLRSIAFKAPNSTRGI